jgi:hypothetical protein
LVDGNRETWKLTAWTFGSNRCFSDFCGWFSRAVKPLQSPGMCCSTTEQMLQETIHLEDHLESG